MYLSVRWNLYLGPLKLASSRGPLNNFKKIDRKHSKKSSTKTVPLTKIKGTAKIAIVIFGALSKRALLGRSSQWKHDFFFA